LKNEFKKMMRDTRVEQMKMYKVSYLVFVMAACGLTRFQAEQEERRRLEGILRQIRKDSGQLTPKKLPSAAVAGS
jgi:hypothetical protein